MESKSDVYAVTDCPIPRGLTNYHEGLDTLLNLMGSRGLKLYRADKKTDLGGKEGFIDKSDVVLIKVNAQWKHRGCTNSDLVRGLIQRILELTDRGACERKHPEYFHEVRKWQRAYILSMISVLAFSALTSLNNVLYSNSFLGLFFSVGGLIVALFFFFTLLKVRSVAKKFGVSWRKTLWIDWSLSRIYYQKLIIRAVARGTGRGEKEIEEKMKRHTTQD